MASPYNPLEDLPLPAPAAARFFAIRSLRVVTPGAADPAAPASALARAHTVGPATLVVDRDSGTIAAVLPGADDAELARRFGKEVVAALDDVGSAVVMPGVVDACARTGFCSDGTSNGRAARHAAAVAATRGALAGGVTTVVDHPVRGAPPLTPQAAAACLRAGTAAAPFTDVGLISLLHGSPREPAAAAPAPAPAAPAPAPAAAASPPPASEAPSPGGIQRSRSSPDLKVPVPRGAAASPTAPPLRIDTPLRDRLPPEPNNRSPDRNHLVASSFMDSVEAESLALGTHMTVQSRHVQPAGSGMWREMLDALHAEQQRALEAGEGPAVPTPMLVDTTMMSPQEITLASPCRELDDAERFTAKSPLQLIPTNWYGQEESPSPLHVRAGRGGRGRGKTVSPPRNLAPGFDHLASAEAALDNLAPASPATSPPSPSVSPAAGTTPSTDGTPSPPTPSPPQLSATGGRAFANATEREGATALGGVASPSRFTTRPPFVLDELTLSPEATKQPWSPLTVPWSNAEAAVAVVTPASSVAAAIGRDVSEKGLWRPVQTIASSDLSPEVTKHAKAAAATAIGMALHGGTATPSGADDRASPDEKARAEALGAMLSKPMTEGRGGGEAAPEAAGAPAGAQSASSKARPIPGGGRKKKKSRGLGARSSSDDGKRSHGGFGHSPYVRHRSEGNLLAPESIIAASPIVQQIGIVFEEEQWTDMATERARIAEAEKARAEERVAERASAAAASEAGVARKKATFRRHSDGYNTTNYDFVGSPAEEDEFKAFELMMKSPKTSNRSRKVAADRLYGAVVNAEIQSYSAAAGFRASNALAHESIPPPPPLLEEDERPSLESPPPPPPGSPPPLFPEPDAKETAPRRRSRIPSFSKSFKNVRNSFAAAVGFKKAGKKKAKGTAAEDDVPPPPPPLLASPDGSFDSTPGGSFDSSGDPTSPKSLPGSKSPTQLPLKMVPTTRRSSTGSHYEKDNAKLLNAFAAVAKASSSKSSEQRYFQSPFGSPSGSSLGGSPQTDSPGRRKHRFRPGADGQHSSPIGRVRKSSRSVSFDEEGIEPAITGQHRPPPRRSGSMGSISGATPYTAAGFRYGMGLDGQLQRTEVGHKASTDAAAGPVQRVVTARRLRDAGPAEPRPDRISEGTPETKETPPPAPDSPVVAAPRADKPHHRRQDTPTDANFVSKGLSPAPNRVLTPPPPGRTSLSHRGPGETTSDEGSLTPPPPFSLVVVPNNPMSTVAEAPKSPGDSDDSLTPPRSPGRELPEAAFSGSSTEGEAAADAAADAAGTTGRRTLAIPGRPPPSPTMPADAAQGKTEPDKAEPAQVQAQASLSESSSIQTARTTPEMRPAARPAARPVTPPRFEATLALARPADEASKGTAAAAEPVVYRGGSLSTGRPTTLSVGTGRPTVLAVGTARPTALAVGTAQPTTLSVGTGRPTALAVGTGRPTTLSVGTGRPTTLAVSIARPTTSARPVTSRPTTRPIAVGGGGAGGSKRPGGGGSRLDRLRPGGMGGGGGSREGRPKPIVIFKESDRLTRRAMRREYGLYVGKHSSASGARGLWHLLRVLAKLDVAVGALHVHVIECSSTQLSELLRNELVALSSRSPSPPGKGMVAAGRGKIPLSASTSCCYLTHAAEDVAPGDTVLKVSPPLLHDSHRNALWTALGEGTIALITSGHCVLPARAKLLQQGDFLRAAPGAETLGAILPAVWTHAKARGYGLDRVVDWLCAAPAKLLGLDVEGEKSGRGGQGRKGRLEAGFDADFLIFNPETGAPSPEVIRKREPLTIYASPKQPLMGLVRRTYLRGTVVYRDGAVVGTARGKLLTSTRAPCPRGVDRGSSEAFRSPAK